MFIYQLIVLVGLALSAASAFAVAPANPCLLAGRVDLKEDFVAYCDKVEIEPGAVIVRHGFRFHLYTNSPLVVNGGLTIMCFEPDEEQRLTTQTSVPVCENGELAAPHVVGEFTIVQSPTGKFDLDFPSAQDYVEHLKSGDYARIEYVGQFQGAKRTASNPVIPTLP